MSVPSTARAGASSDVAPAPAPAPAAPPRARRRAAPALAVAVVLAAFFAPAVGSREFVYRDTGRMHAPVKRWIGEELRAGRLPQWNPYAGLGEPVLANGIDAVWHPFTALTVALPPGTAVKAWVLLSFALAAAGAFVWARGLSSSGPAAAVAAIAFALSGPLVSSSDNLTYLTTYATAPWVLAAGHALARRGGAGRAALVGAASFFCAAAGDPQAWAISVAFVPLLAVAFAPAGERAKALRRGLLGAAVAVAAAAPVIAPIALWVPHSSRAQALGDDDLLRWNVHPRRLAELVMPELFRGPPEDPVASDTFSELAGNDATSIPWFLSLYLGASVVALALVAAARDRRARLLAALAALFLWAALGHYGGFVQAVRGIPVLGTFRFWEKMTAWVALLVTAAAARGVDAIVERRLPRRASIWAGAAAALALVLAVAARVDPAAIGRAVGARPALAGAMGEGVGRGALHAGLVLALVAGVLASMERGRLGRAAPLALGAVVVLDLFGGNAGAYFLGPPQRQEPPPLAGVASGRRIVNAFKLREDRWPALGHVGSVWEWARRTLAASFNVAYRVDGADEYVALRDARWSRFRESDGAHPQHLGLFAFDLVVVPKEPRLASTFGFSPPFRVEGADPELPAFLVAIDHRPRAYVAREVAEVDAAGALAFVSSDAAPGRSVVEGAVPPGVGPVDGDARISRDGPDDVEVEARAPGRALLVLNDLYAPGWTASVDGAPAPIVRANWAARGVWIEPGEHRVRFRYRTPGLVPGAIAALLAAIALGAWGAGGALARRRGATG